jgi:hypothetical protein
MYLEDITQGRSHGCTSHRCRGRYEVALQLEAELGARFVGAHKLRERLDAWLFESGRRDRIEMAAALNAEDDNDDPPATRACVRRDLTGRAR